MRASAKYPKIAAANQISAVEAHAEGKRSELD